jgi:hypothetical protein
MGDTLAPDSFVVLSVETNPDIVLVALLDAHLRGPLASKIRKNVVDLVEVHAVTACIGACTFGLVDLTVRHGLHYKPSQIARLIFFVVVADVKFEIQPDHFGIFGMRDDQGDLNDPQTARNPA